MALEEALRPPPSSQGQRSTSVLCPLQVHGRKQEEKIDNLCFKNSIHQIKISSCTFVYERFVHCIINRNTLQSCCTLQERTKTKSCVWVEHTLWHDDTHVSGNPLHHTPPCCFFLQIRLDVRHYNCLQRWKSSLLVCITVAERKSLVVMWDTSHLVDKQSC